MSVCQQSPGCRVHVRKVRCRRWRYPARLAPEVPHGAKAQKSPFGGPQGRERHRNRPPDKCQGQSSHKSDVHPGLPRRECCPPAADTWLASRCRGALGGCDNHGCRRTARSAVGSPAGDRVSASWPSREELADVVRHEHEAERQRVRRNQHVVGADRPAAPFEVRAHLGAGHGRGAVERPTGDLPGQGIEPAAVGGTGASPESGMARRPRSACAAPYGRVCSSCQRGWWWRAQRSVTVPSIMARAVPGYATVPR